LTKEKLRPVERAALARALCDVDKRIRAWKGLADPSPFCPDGVPMKRVKIRAGRTIDAIGSVHPDDEPKPARQPKRDEPTTPTPTPAPDAEKKKESLLEADPSPQGGG
jgi:outer membrane biosynthesis protein TonB